MKVERISLTGLNNSRLEVDVAFDRGNDVIHILDRKEICKTSLTQAMNSKLQKEISEKLLADKDINYYRWYLYHTDNTITQFINNEFDFLKEEANDLYEPFKKVMKDLNEVRKSIFLFKEKPEILLTEIKKENVEVINLESMDFIGKFKGKLKENIINEIKKIICGDQEADSIRANLEKKIKNSNLDKKSVFVATISTYIGTKLGSLEIGVIATAVVSIFHEAT